MSIFSKVEDAAKSIKDDYEKSIARGKGIEAEAKSEVTAVVADIKAVAERVVEVAEPLEAQALGEVAKFTNAAADALAKLSEYAARLDKDIAGKSDALAQVKAAIAKLQSMQPVADTPTAAS